MWLKPHTWKSQTHSLNNYIEINISEVGLENGKWIYNDSG
jgi:hypothetical protein